MWSCLWLIVWLVGRGRLGRHRVGFYRYLSRYLSENLKVFTVQYLGRSKGIYQLKIGLELRYI